MRGVNVVSNNTELLSVCVYVRVFVATVTAMLEWLVNLFCVHVCVCLIVRIRKHPVLIFYLFIKPIPSLEKKPNS